MADGETFPGGARSGAGARPEATARVLKGARRLLAALGQASVVELPLPGGRRADIVGLARDGEVWIVEVKSCVEDFKGDRKWREYRAWCDRLLFAAPVELGPALFPEDVGVILADAHGAELIRPAPEHRLSARARRDLVARLARLAASRLHQAEDPGAHVGEFEG